MKTGLRSDAEQLIQAARLGSGDALGELLGRFEKYLRLIAELEIGRSLQGKVDPADLVQDTFLEAHQHFASFRGQTETELATWLRKILAGVLGNLIRRFTGTRGRDIRLERELSLKLDHTSRVLRKELIAPDSSPSHQAARQEQGVLLANALGGLPPDYRQAIILRNLEGLSFVEMARRMARSEDSVQKLWIRALAKLRREMGARP